MVSEVVVTPLESNSHPHFKQPPAQGWALTCHDKEVADLRWSEAERARYWRQRNGLDSERTREVTASLNTLFDSITKGSEKLHDGLPALSLDGQALAVAITANLARPAIPRTLLRGLCMCCGGPMHGAGDGRSVRQD